MLNKLLSFDNKLKNSVRESYELGQVSYFLYHSLSRLQCPSETYFQAGHTTTLVGRIQFENVVFEITCDGRKRYAYKPFVQVQQYKFYYSRCV
jgi:hypothetical protein